MKLDASLSFASLDEVPQLIRTAEQFGFDGLWISETHIDPFLPLALAAEHIRRPSLGTTIAIAFARSPAILAQTAWDLQRLSQGRFILGLGTQISIPTQRQHASYLFKKRQGQLIFRMGDRRVPLSSKPANPSRSKAAIISGTCWGDNFKHPATLHLSQS